MEDRDLIERMARLHWRLRLRSPATAVEKGEWHALIKELRSRFPASTEHAPGA